MKLSSLRTIAGAYLMSIAFWCGLALLMGLLDYGNTRRLLARLNSDPVKCP